MRLIGSPVPKINGNTHIVKESDEQSMLMCYHLGHIINVLLMYLLS